MNSLIIKSLSVISGQKIIYPFYHAVNDVVPLHLRQLYPLHTCKQFENDLDDLLKVYKPVDIYDVLKWNQEKRTPSFRAFHLSFDDGLREVFEIIAPILKRKGIPATFFINSAFVDNKKLFYRFKASIIAEALFRNSVHNREIVEVLKINEIKDSSSNFVINAKYNQETILNQIAKVLNIDFDNYLLENKPYMSTSQISQLAADGFAIGAHSVDHPLYSQLSELEQQRQTIDSLNYINETFHPSVRLFSFPFTDSGVNKSFFEAISLHVDLTFGTAGIKRDSVDFNLQRIPVEKSASSAKEYIQKEYILYMIKKILNKHIVQH